MKHHLAILVLEGHIGATDRHLAAHESQGNEYSDHQAKLCREEIEACREAILVLTTPPTP